MDKTFHEIQAKVAKRLIHSDRHRRRKSIAPDIVTCNSKNHDLSRLMVKNEVLFKNLEGTMSSLQNEQRRREKELLRTERSVAGSVRKRSLPHLTNKSYAQESQTRGKIPASKQLRRNSLVKDGIHESPTSCNQLVQKWLQSFDRNKSTSKNTLEVPSFFDPVLEPKSAFGGRKSGFVSELLGADLESNGGEITNDNTTENVLQASPFFELEPKIHCFEGEEALDTKFKSDSDLESENGLITSTSAFIEADRMSSSLYTLAKVRIFDIEDDATAS